MRSAGGASVHCAVHGSPGVPFFAPSSHSSVHSTTPLPHASTRQLAEQPSQERVLPSSHCSPISTRPLPQTAGLFAQTRRTWLLRMILPSTAVAASVKLRSPDFPRACGTRSVTSGEQALAASSGGFVWSTVVPASSATGVVSRALTSAATFAASVASAGLTAFGRRRLTDWMP